MQNKKYYLGLDIGTDSAGYAATTTDYSLLKFKGEPVWGVMTFEAASNSAARRMQRTARRRIDRRQQRVALINEIFAKEIAKKDDTFFIRRKESALFAEDTTDGVKIFNGNGLTDTEYHKSYPTIHHLINELMTSDRPHDARLVYLACAWLVAHRGHFLFDVPSENIDSLLDFKEVYGDFCAYLHDEIGCKLPWTEETDGNTILRIMQMNTGVGKKSEAFKAEVFAGKKPSKEAEASFPYSREAIVKLLSGGKVKPVDIFCKEEFREIESLSLQMNDEDFTRILSELGDDGVLLRKLRAMRDCAQLISTMSYADEKGPKTISTAKIAIYKQHKDDLEWLKKFIKKYLPGKYNEIFRKAGAENYVAYSNNSKSCREGQTVKKANKESFSTYLLKITKDISVTQADTAGYQDMLTRLEARTFLPKQSDTDNRIIPQQLYRYELATLLSRAENYLPFLGEKDADTLSNTSKILSVFDFKIPYFVGPLRKDNGKNAWLVRKAEGKIYPWNFTEKVDLDASEQGFIRRMTNTCTYLPGEDVLPYNSLLYSRFMVLNEINCLKINDRPVSVEIKQGIFTDLFMKNRRVKAADIKNYLRNRGCLYDNDTVSGIDTAVKSSLKSYHIFRTLLIEQRLTELQVEEIINHAAYSEDRSRFLRWLAVTYPQLSEEDRKYISKQQLKEFGRLSAKLLTGVYGTDKTQDTGEAFTIMDALWQTNCNLMQLLSEKFSFQETIAEIAQEYYTGNPSTLSDRLSEMYISNAVKRPIIRALSIAKEVEKAIGCPPEKIFVEMARGGTPEQKGKRTRSRKQQLLELYKKVKTEDSRSLSEELEAMGDTADNRLQSDKLFLYYIQLGKCLYTGHAIDLSRINDGTYNIEHIYPRHLVKDDSILNNEILVESEINGLKSGDYPVSEEIRNRMQGYWLHLKTAGFITEEKYHRLTRSHPFTDDEKQGFINRQLVETRQSTKVIAMLLKEEYPETEVVYVKAGMVSEFRQEFSMLKSRAINDLHHAKDAYLNIVVGNVYHERFTKQWFNINKTYNVQVKSVFKNPLRHGSTLIWNGEEGIAKVRKILQKNAVHLTQYSICRHSGQNGGFFDQNPLKASAGLIPRKKNLPTEKYGGYSGSTATFFVLLKLLYKGKTDLMFFPVELLFSKRFLQDSAFRKEYIEGALSNAGKKFDSVSYPLGDRILKINTLLSMDGFRACIAGGSLKDGRLGLLPMMQLSADYETQLYIKRLEMLQKKKAENKTYRFSEEYDKITKQENAALYEFFVAKLEKTIYSKRPKAPTAVLIKRRENFLSLKTEEQAAVLLQVLLLFARQSNPIDLSLLNESKLMAKPRMSLSLASWKKEYTDIRIIDTSPSGLHETISENLLDML